MTAPSIALLFSYPLPTAGRGRDFHPIERVPAGRTKTKATNFFQLIAFGLVTIQFEFLVHALSKNAFSLLGISLSRWAKASSGGVTPLGW